jgi:hypothetical protein
MMKRIHACMIVHGLVLTAWGVAIAAMAVAK